MLISCRRFSLCDGERGIELGAGQAMSGIPSTPGYGCAIVFAAPYRGFPRSCRRGVVGGLVLGWGQDTASDAEGRTCIAWVWIGRLRILAGPHVESRRRVKRTHFVGTTLILICLSQGLRRPATLISIRCKRRCPPSSRESQAMTSDFHHARMLTYSDPIKG